jgi:transposase
MAPANQEVALRDFASMHGQLLRHKHLTLDLLWQEYKQTYQEGYQYGWVCELYGRWASKLDAECV